MEPPNFLRITSSISAITRFVHVLITCGKAYTRKYRPVDFKIKTSKMMNENVPFDLDMGV